MFIVLFALIGASLAAPAPQFGGFSGGASNAAAGSQTFNSGSYLFAICCLSNLTWMRNLMCSKGGGFPGGFGGGFSGSASNAAASSQNFNQGGMIYNRMVISTITN